MSVSKACFGKCSLRQNLECHDCKSLQHCKQKTQQNLIARALKPLPPVVIAKAFELLAREVERHPDIHPMDSLERFSYEGESYSVVDVLSSVVNRTAMIGEGDGIGGNSSQNFNEHKRVEKRTVFGNLFEPPKKKSVPINWMPEEMFCINNSGMEEDFDRGMTYLVKKHEDAEMLYVVNRFGDTVAVLKARFSEHMP